ncbi:hypothetical protein ACHAXA_010604 [Cyclostephanos tholiformis]|uniref:Uncharacterized protein n=1 Tax=Cyclostephanos tholiformis TaxID=382380 RepID=A0ABD3R9L5_9STRA
MERCQRPAKHVGRALSVAFVLLLTKRQLGMLVRLHSSGSHFDDGGRRRRDDDYSPPQHAIGRTFPGSSSGGPTEDIGMSGIVTNPEEHAERRHFYMELNISPTDAVCLGTVEPEYASTTLDWWPLGTEAWGNSSILNADLRHPNLIAAATGLSPSYLRLGGTQADEILYHMGDRGGVAKDDDDDDGNHEHDRYVAKECRRHAQRCLTKDRWVEMLDFARDVGARIVFTIAYVRHTRDNDGNNDVRDWDSVNARRLLEYTRSNSDHAKRGTVYGFELGNELRHKGKIKNVTRIVEAYRELGRMVDDIWDDGQLYPRPKIMGPASTGGVDESSFLISEIGPYIDVATYHKYHGGGKDPNMPHRARHPSFHVHPTKLSGPGEAVERYVVGRRRTDDDDGGGGRMSSRLWIGEGAMAYNSGLPGVSDSFGGSLWFANLLGALAKTKPLSHGVYCRQALLGGYYELVSHESMVPNPDYWVAYLWKNLVDTKAVGPIISPGRRDSAELSSLYTFGCCEKPGKDTVLIHSFCAKSDNSNGDVVFIIINISKSSGINLNITMGEERTEYTLQPKNEEEGTRSRGVLLNGHAMSIGSDGNLPGVHERGVARMRGDLTYVPPISITFVLVHGAEVEECQVKHYD